MNRLKILICCLLSGMLALCLSACGVPSETSAVSPEPPSPAASATPSPTPVQAVSPSPEREIIQPDPEHLITREGRELFMAGYDTEYMAYNLVDSFRPDLYLALGKTNLFMPGLPNEHIEGSAHLTDDGLLHVGLTVNRPHDGGALDGVGIHITYDPASDSISDLSVEDFTGLEGIVYTIDYTLYKVVSTFEAYIRLNGRHYFGSRWLLSYD